MSEQKETQWNLAYAVVLALLVIEIVLLYLFSVSFK